MISPLAQVHKSALVSKDAEIEAGVIVERGAVIEACSLQRGARIMAGATCGEGCEIGAGATVLPGAVVPAGTTVMDGTTFPTTPTLPFDSWWWTGLYEAGAALLADIVELNTCPTRVKETRRLADAIKFSDSPGVMRAWLRTVRALHDAEIAEIRKRLTPAQWVRLEAEAQAQFDAEEAAREARS